MDKRMKYRSRSDIASEILQTMSHGNITLTRIMYCSFTSYVQTKEYVAFLEKKGLIRFDAPTRSYGMTEEGVKFLGKLRDIGSILSIEQPMSPDITGSYVTAAPVARTRRAVAKSELDSRPIALFA
jgi:predicted transcriptional regulator